MQAQGDLTNQIRQGTKGYHYTSQALNKHGGSRCINNEMILCHKKIVTTEPQPQVYQPYYTYSIFVS